MELKSTQITNENLVQNILNAISPYLEQLSENVDELIGIKIDFKEQTVYILYFDYTEERQRLQEIVSQALIIKEQLQHETDVIKVAVLQGRLTELAKEYDKLKEILNLDLELYDLI